MSCRHHELGLLSSGLCGAATPDPACATTGRGHGGAAEGFGVPVGFLSSGVRQEVAGKGDFSPRVRGSGVGCWKLPGIPGRLGAEE